MENRSLSLTHLRRVTVGCFPVIARGYLVTYAGILAPVLGAIGTVASLGYCAARYSWTRLGIAEFVFFTMFGSVAVVGTYYSQAAPFFIDRLRGASLRKPCRCVPS